MPVSLAYAHFRIFLVSLLLLLFISNAHAETIYVFGNSSGNTTISSSSIPGSWTYGVDLGGLNIYFKTKLTSSDAVHFEVKHLDEERSVDYQLQNANASLGIVSGDSI